MNLMHRDLFLESMNCLVCKAFENVNIDYFDVYLNLNKKVRATYYDKH